MLILTGSVVDGKTEALCSVCYQVVGLFTQRELGEMAKSLNAIYCFECDSVNADKVPDCLYDEQELYFIFYGGQPVPVNVWQEVRAKDKMIESRNNLILDLNQRINNLCKGVNQ